MKRWYMVTLVAMAKADARAFNTEEDKRTSRERLQLLKRKLKQQQNLFPPGQEKPLHAHVLIRISADQKLYFHLSTFSSALDSTDETRITIIL